MLISFLIHLVIKLQLKEETTMQTFPHSKNAIPSFNREWLRQLRQLYGYTHTDMEKICGISYITYAGLENPHKASARMATYRTMRKVADEFSIKTDLFFFPTDDKTGKLLTKDSVMDIILLYNHHGFKHVTSNATFLHHIFAPEIARYVLETFNY